MNHHPLHILQQWLPQQHETNWLLATVIATERSSYRKPGAMMLFSERGDQLGVVSGGCLESDVFHQARRCWLTGKSKIVTYDMQDEGDVAWQLGIGCGGAVTLLLQPLSAANHYLHLAEVARLLLDRHSVTLNHSLSPGLPLCTLGPLDRELGTHLTQDSHSNKRARERAGQASAGIPLNSHLSRPGTASKAIDSGWFSHTVTPPPALLILGGGVDARPLVSLAARIGWIVSVADPRARYARSDDFDEAHFCLTQSPGQLAEHCEVGQANAIVIMHHHIGLDAEALQLVHKIQHAQRQSLERSGQSHLRYVALLGPGHRTQRVLDEAGLTQQDFMLALNSPAGLDIGGELPESIALSILSQAHAVLHGRPAKRSA